MTSCHQCGQALETPLGCSPCGALLSAPEAATPFEIFGLPEAFELDPDGVKDLKKRLLRFSRVIHPDFYAGRPEEALAEQNTAKLNEAFETLESPTRRADYLVRHWGGPDDAQERAMPQEFLMEVMEWNEALEEARDGGWSQAVADLEAELNSRRAQALTVVAQQLTKASAETLLAARKQLNAIRYVDRALQQINDLRVVG